MLHGVSFFVVCCSSIFRFFLNVSGMPKPKSPEQNHDLESIDLKRGRDMYSMPVILFDILRHDLLLLVFLQERRKDTMKVSRRLWWAFGGIFLLLCVGFVSAAYRFGWSTTGFLDKSLWDWLQLLIVPFVLAVGGLVFQLANTRTESHIAQQRYEQDQKIAQQRYEQDQKIALDKQREDLLQAYLDRIAELLLGKKPDGSPSEEASHIARVRTITVLTQLNAQRIGYIFTFLREAGLMSTASTTRSMVSLKDADLRAVEWGQASLSGANLSGANLNTADLSDADLANADLSETHLVNANLSGVNLINANFINANLNSANLSGANLINANLSGANLINANLSGANLHNANLSGANLYNADLGDARLSGTNLYNADLGDADLKDADLSGADLVNANLGDADLSGANLYHADLSDADLYHANLSGADLSGADLDDADLSDAKVTEGQLKEVESLGGTTMPDGSTHA
jgi:uncharacterized protein YjbI with pentapeptide repeats